ncbi:hypothetical protein SAMN05518672_101260 [Chitinophaga sp. CF118]|uniref:hypothetical protein n=1 Tax=Chitinophaga sp. CF118 TaxID=1884367 RepID=UPI0008ED3C05|nr:hypothetical protein [Chitinophaga sp. CF118]SFD05732.1 hypothetical protein SAMN05518672_101260 [Chitinophaga sp. CF118]
MKTNQLITLILVFYISACANNNSTKTGTTTAVNISDSFGTGKIIDTVICRTDSSQSYALYIPAKGNKEALPVIYFFDAHADGVIPLNKYKSLADTYGYILIGSNNSKNGNDWSTTENIWRHLSEDTQSRLKINSNRIYTCGFSGGAKAAGYVALKYPAIKGVIANGAGLPDGTPAGDFAFSYTAIAGEGDLNLTDIMAFENELNRSRTRHHIILFDGKHEWAPENSMNTAFAGLQFDAMQKGIIPKDDTLINLYIEKSKKRLEAYYKANQFIKAEQECQLSISFLNGLTDKVTWFKEKSVSIIGNSLYLKQQHEQEHLLVTELNIKAGYGEHFQQIDMAYWEKTISELQTKAHIKTAESGMYQRLLAYLSLAFYSYSNQLINRNANNEGRYYVELYKIVDPTNSEAWYFSAILHARENKPKEAENDLLKAVKNGFREKNRLQQQPEFQTSSQINLSAIESKMLTRVYH